MATMNELGAKIHEWARSKGFYKREFVGPMDTLNPSMPAEKLALITSEVSEVLEALRDGDYEHEAEEVADIIIRVLDYAHWRGIDVDSEVEFKMHKNEGRPYLHGRTF